MRDFETAPEARESPAHEEEREREAAAREPRDAAEMGRGARLAVREAHLAVGIDGDRERGARLDRLEQVAGERRERDPQVVGIADDLERGPVRPGDRDVLRGEGGPRLPERLAQELDDLDRRAARRPEPSEGEEPLE